MEQLSYPRLGTIEEDLLAHRQKMATILLSTSASAFGVVIATVVDILGSNLSKLMSYMKQ